MCGESKATNYSSTMARQNKGAEHKQHENKVLNGLKEKETQNKKKRTDGTTPTVPKKKKKKLEQR